MYEIRYWSEVVLSDDSHLEIMKMRTTPIMPIGTTIDFQAPGHWNDNGFDVEIEHYEISKVGSISCHFTDIGGGDIHFTGDPKLIKEDLLTMGWTVI